MEKASTCYTCQRDRHPESLCLNYILIFFEACVKVTLHTIIRANITHRARLSGLYPGLFQSCKKIPVIRVPVSCVLNRPVQTIKYSTTKRPQKRGLPALQKDMKSVAEQRQNVLAVLVGNRQSLNTKLLLHLK